MLCKNCIVFFWINSKYDAKRFVNGHPDSEWCDETVGIINETGDFAPKEGSRKPKSVCTKENIELEQEIILT